MEKASSKKPELFLLLKEISVSKEVVNEAHRLLREERRFEEKVSERRYSSRYRGSSNSTTALG